MILNVLAVGDVVGDSGVEYLSAISRGLKKLKGVHFTVVSRGERVRRGILPGRPGGSLTPVRMLVPWATTPGTTSRSPTFWRMTGMPSAPPATPAGCPSGAGACTTAPAACHRRHEPDWPVRDGRYFDNPFTHRRPGAQADGGPMWCWWTSTPRPPARRGP